MRTQARTATTAASATSLRTVLLRFLPAFATLFVAGALFLFSRPAAAAHASDEAVNAVGQMLREHCQQDIKRGNLAWMNDEQHAAFCTCLDRELKPALQGGDFASPQLNDPVDGATIKAISRKIANSCMQEPFSAIVAERTTSQCLTEPTAFPGFAGLPQPAFREACTCAGHNAGKAADLSLTAGGTSDAMDRQVAAAKSDSATSCLPKISMAGAGQVQSRH